MYTYGTRLRPPDIWCVPKTGLKEVSSSEFTAGGRHYWGHAVYDRELTKEELEHYDMDQINTVNDLWNKGGLRNGYSEVCKSNTGYGMSGEHGADR